MTAAVAAVLIGAWIALLAWSTPQPLSAPVVTIALPRPEGPQKPLSAFARPFDSADKRPRVALILSNATDRTSAQMTAAIGLPGGVTLAFTPYTRDLPEWIGRAREAGHEVLLGLPMEPADMTIADPGPLALLTTLDAKANGERLDRIMKSASGYVGVLPLDGRRFLEAPGKLRPILEEVSRRGVLFVDTGGPAHEAVAANAGTLPSVKVDQLIQGETRDALERRLAELETAARQGGAAIGLAPMSPAAIDRIGAWAAGLEARGVALAPVTAMLPK